MHPKKHHIHIVGIGGIGMSALAKLLIRTGYVVSGSDINQSDITNQIELLGASVFIGHNKKQIKGADELVISSAIDNNNEEIQAAKSKKIPIISRAKMLAKLIDRTQTIAITGTHGKTSTTALIGNLLQTGGFDPTVIIGGILREENSNVIIGNSNYTVLEADESDGSFLNFSPTIAVITNIDRDHIDFYGNLNNIKETFSNFLAKVPDHGKIILCLDDDTTRKLIPKIKDKIITYGITQPADFKADNITHKEMKSQFELNHFNKNHGKITTNGPGLHNIYNTLASIAVGWYLGIPFNVIRNSIKNFGGIRRRMELKGVFSNVTVMDDYAHHPTEILATLDALQKSWPDKRKVVVFQPHRYTRTQALFNELTNSFYNSDVVIIMPIYAANEKLISSIKSEDLCKMIQRKKYCSAFYAYSFENCLQKLRYILKNNDLLITLGAGNVHQIGETIIKTIKLTC